MRFVSATVVIMTALGCGDSSSTDAVDASVDSVVVINPPLECPTAVASDGCSALPSLPGTWKFSPSTTATITFTATAPQMLAGATSGTTSQMMHLFDGDWTVEANAAWRCSRSGAARMLSVICMKTSGELRIDGETRAPGFHTAYETLEYFSGVLAP